MLTIQREQYKQLRMKMLTFTDINAVYVHCMHDINRMLKRKNIYICHLSIPQQSLLCPSVKCGIHSFKVLNKNVISFPCRCQNNALQSSASVQSSSISNRMLSCTYRITLQTVPLKHYHKNRFKRFEGESVGSWHQHIACT